MTVNYISTWLDFYRRFTDEARTSMSDRYQAVDNSPKALIDALCARPDRLLKQVTEFAMSTARLALIEEFILDHDLQLPLDQFNAQSLEPLFEMGIVGLADPEHVVMPGGVAAILAPMVNGVRTSMVTLLGDCTHAEVTSMGARYGIARDTRIETILALGEFFTHDDILESITTRVPDFDYLGAALVAIELGGVCFWQEVFGFELESPSGANVVPFMRRDERQVEQDIADNLRELGVVFRIDREPHPMLVVPEELWDPLWTMGRGWLSDWCVDTFSRLTEQAMGRSRTNGKVPLQNALKVLNVVAATQKLEDVKQLTSIHPALDWPTVWSLAIETSVITLEESNAESTQVADGLMDSSKTDFSRQILLEWILGYLGSAADTGLGGAIGVDDEWRARTVGILDKSFDFAPLWLRGDGVDPQTTGGGLLRDAADGEDELVLLEFQLMTEIVSGAKLLFLDMLSLLDSNYWYPVEALVEFLQMTVAWSTFDRIAHVLSRPGVGYYVPMQRASLVTDPYHADDFRTWFLGVVHMLWEPLGVAELHDGWVWFDTAALRVPTPAGLPEDARQRVIAEIFDDPDLEFRPPKNKGGFRSIPRDNSNPDALSCDLPIAQLRAQIEGRKVTTFDGENIFTN